MFTFGEIVRTLECASILLRYILETVNPMHLSDKGLVSFFTLFKKLHCMVQINI